jgi:hypothetical protein
MAEVTAETMKQLQARVKTLQGSREQVLRTQAVQEQKRDEAFQNLRQLGVQDPEAMTAKQLQALADEKRAELAQKVAELEQQLAQGEALVTKFQELQQEG